MVQQFSNDEIHKRLAELFLDERSFYELESELQSFDLFSALGATRSELRHGKWLSVLLNPSYPHGFGDVVLRRFLFELQGTNAFDSLVSPLGPRKEFSKLGIHLASLDDCVVHPEYSVLGVGNRIDLVIRIPSLSLIIVIELKVDSGEGVNQLKRYRDQICSLYPLDHKLFVYLTAQGQFADEESWVTVDLPRMVQSFVSPSLPSGHKDAVMLLDAYARMIRRQLMDDNELAAIARDLWRRHRAALEYLADRRPDELADVIALLPEFPRHFNGRHAENTRLVQDSANAGLSRFSVEIWDNLPRFAQPQAERGWSSSGRIVLYQFSRAGQGGNSLVLRAYLGPQGEMEGGLRMELRQALRQQFNSLRTENDRWDMIASSAILYTPNLEQPEDPNTVFQSIAEGASAFVIQTEHLITQSLELVLGNRS